MRLFLDINVVLDVCLCRAPWHIEADALWNANHERRIDALISAASLPTIFYIVGRQAGLRQAKLAVETCLDAFEIIGVNRPIIRAALEIPGDDFEDNLQIACAIEGKADALVTRDRAGFQGVPIEVLTTSEALARFVEQPNS